MNQNLLNELKATILNLEIPKSEEEFGGAGLIVTKDPTWTGRGGNVVVLTPHAAEISWLIFQLKEVYDKFMNYFQIGEAANHAINAGKDLRGILTAVVTVAEATGESTPTEQKRKIKRRIALADGWYFNFTIYQGPGASKVDSMFLDNHKE